MNTGSDRNKLYPARSHGNSYIFYEVANSYEWPTPNPAPKPTRHWGLDKSYKIVRISHLVKYVRIAVR